MSPRIPSTAVLVLARAALVAVAFGVAAYPTFAHAKARGESNQESASDTRQPPLSADEKADEKSARAEIERILATYRRATHRSIKFEVDYSMRTPWSFALSDQNPRLRLLKRESELAEKGAWETAKSLFLSSRVQESEIHLNPDSEAPHAEEEARISALSSARWREERAKADYEQLVADFERVTGHKPAIPIPTQGSTPYTDLQTYQHDPGHPLTRVRAEMAVAQTWSDSVRRWTRDGALRAEEIQVDKSKDYPYTAAKTKFEALYTERVADLQYRSRLAPTLDPYEKRMGRLPAGLLDLTSAHPYTDAYYKKRAELAKIDQENLSAQEWGRKLPTWTASGLFQPAELAVDATKDYFYTENFPKLSGLYSDRFQEANAKRQIEAVIAPYVKRVGHVPAGLIDTSRPTPYYDALRFRHATLDAISRENSHFDAWGRMVAEWTKDGIIDPKEIVLDTTRDYPYTELHDKLYAIYGERSQERRRRAQFEGVVNPYVARMGRTIAGLLDPNQKYPYTYATNSQSLVLAKISTENENAQRWSSHVARWTRDGVLNPADIAVDLKSGDFPYTVALMRYNALYDNLRVEVEHRKKIDELAAYYKDLGRTDVDLTPVKGAKTPYADLVYKYKSLIDSLPEELEARRKLETLRRVQLKAGDPNPIGVPPQNTTSMRPYRELLADSAALFRKYEDAIREERVPELIAALQERVYTVQRPFHTYHWGDRTRLNAYWNRPGPSADDPSGVRMFAGAVPVYYNTNASISGNRDGFYAAIDPSATSIYGLQHSEWYLQRVEVPPGARFLSTFEADEVLRKNEALLRDLGCALPYSPMNATGLFVTHPGLENNGGLRPCDKLTRRLIQELKLDAVLYNYSFSRIMGCDGGKLDAKTNGAMLFTDGGQIKATNVRTFTKDTRDATDERKFIQALLTERNGGNKLWADIDPAKDRPAADELNALKKRNLLKCGDFTRVVPLEKRYQCLPEEGAMPKSLDELTKTLNAVGAAK